MRRNRERSVFRRAMVLALLVSVAPAFAAAAEWVHEGMADEGKMTFGFRVGPSFMTQSSGLSTTGPALNFQGMYGINKWFICKARK